MKRLLLKPPATLSDDLKRSTLNTYREKYGLNVLVETGTLLGDTVEYFKTRCQQVISIELAQDLARRAQKRFESDPNVTIIQGDSGIVLKEVVKSASQPMLFWLDGHYSHEFALGDLHITTARADLETPIEEELKTILASPYMHVVLIDDARLFTGLHDYPTLSEVRAMVKNSGKRYDVVVKDDIIRITP